MEHQERKSRILEETEGPVTHAVKGLEVSVRGSGVDDDGNPAELDVRFEGVTEAIIALGRPSSSGSLTEEQIAEGQEEVTNDILVTGDACLVASLIGDALVTLVRRIGWPSYNHVMQHVMNEVTVALEEDTAAALARQIATQEQPGETPEEMN